MSEAASAHGSAVASPFAGSRRSAACVGATHRESWRLGATDYSELVRVACTSSTFAMRDSAAVMRDACPSRGICHLSAA